MPVQETVATSTKNVDRKFSCGVKKQTFLQLVLPLSLTVALLTFAPLSLVSDGEIRAGARPHLLYKWLASVNDDGRDRDPRRLR